VAVTVLVVLAPQAILKKRVTDSPAARVVGKLAEMLASLSSTTETLLSGVVPQLLTVRL
jgi:hypothetical protein